ncbi:hypothetical protein CASFOL_039344 [Castilleja foliolosa]|uniref:Replication factor A C-terminal domain-containing protein n=1 Tax=Castilleja foliolosa TaxID=1961234 RepID=A0ABD3BHQ4_9LAMI
MNSLKMTILLLTITFRKGCSCCVSKLLCVALLLTFIPQLNPPVENPWICYFYFGFWALFTAIQLLLVQERMIKYNYIPFYYGDKKRGGDAIEATADIKHIEHFDSIIQLQSCYRLSGYIATGQRTYMATVNHPASLVFGRKARFDPAPDMSIPTVYFNFAAYDMLKGRLKDSRLLTGTGKTLRKTLIQDEMNSQVEITLWPEKIHLIDDNVNPGDIVAITSTTVTEHKGRLQLESTYLTTVVINPDTPETIDRVNRLKALPNVQSSSTNEPTTTIADLNLARQHKTQISRNFACKAKIKQIHENRGWYYVLCSKCSNKLFPQQENDKLNFVCTDDDNIIPNFRYYVNATIEDTTGSVDAVFFNESMQSIVNISCKEMVTEHAETSNPKIVPELLKSTRDTTKLLHLTLKTDGQIVVNSVSDETSTTETQPTSSRTTTTTFSPGTPVPKPGLSKRAVNETPGPDKKMKHI